MALLINNDDVRKVLNMTDCIAALSEAFKQQSTGSAANRTKASIHIPTTRPDEWYRYVSMEGGLRDKQVAAIRIKSDIVFADVQHGVRRMDWYAKEKGLYNALILLFSSEDGQLLAILNDGVVQQYRVGATAGVAAELMARRDSRVIGIFGSGGQAHSHALAYAEVFPEAQFKVYSPNPKNRANFASWITEETGREALATAFPQEVAAGADILAACTDAVAAFIKADWIQPGMHVRPVQGVLAGEIEPDGYEKVDRLVSYMSGTAENHFTTPETERPVFLGASTAASMATFDAIPYRHTLPDVLLGKAPGRSSEAEINCFIDEGTGVQFAAVASLVYDRCRERGIGRELPAEWFLQDVKN
jgi:ornithine cyclodeaminase/alanine dehydrogenase-like protein (mu-crystallin family)